MSIRWWRCVLVVEGTDVGGDECFDGVSQPSCCLAQRHAGAQPCGCGGVSTVVHAQWLLADRFERSVPGSRQSLRVRNIRCSGELLRRLEEEGLLVGATDVRGEKLERRTYTLTELGLTKLLKWAVTEPSPAYLRDPLLVKVGFLDLADPAEAATMLRQFREQQEELIAGWEEHILLLREREAPLLKERLKHRPVAIHQAVAELKAIAFQGLIDGARARSECAKDAIRIVEGMAAGGR